jgi:hypothetical protein
MKCVRCQGMMVQERLFTYEGGIAMARCIYCGDLVDAVVMRNRSSCVVRGRNGRHDGNGTAR